MGTKNAIIEKKVLGKPQRINTIKIKSFIVELLTKVNNFDSITSN